MSSWMILKRYFIYLLKLFWLKCYQWQNNNYSMLRFWVNWVKVWKNKLFFSFSKCSAFLRNSKDLFFNLNIYIIVLKVYLYTNLFLIQGFCQRNAESHSNWLCEKNWWIKLSKFIHYRLNIIFPIFLSTIYFHNIL